MKDLSNNQQALRLTEEYFANKIKAEQLESLNKEILNEITRLSEGDPAIIGTRKLTYVSRKGSVSYSSIVKQHLPKLDLEPYRGQGGGHYQLR